MSIHMKRGVAALGVAALTLTTGMLSATAASGEEGAALSADGLGAFTAQAVQETDETIIGAALDGEGQVVLYVDPTKGEAAVDGAVEGYSAAHSNVSPDNIVEIPGGFVSYEDTDVVGGAGYFTAPGLDQQGGACSVGFSAWDSEGNPAFVSAGHCTGDGDNQQAAMTVPSGDPAGGETTPPAFIRGGSVDFTLGQSQFGGPGNDPGPAPGEELPENADAYVDISAYDLADDTLDLLPEVTDWTTTDDLSESTNPVTAVGSPSVGAAVAKSGRTSGYTDGTIVTQAGYALISGRLVSGFETSGMYSEEGDSGGAVMSGNTAIGLISGGPQGGGTQVWVSDLQKGLAQLDGYTVALDLDEPALTSPEDGGTVGRGDAITGTGPAGGELTITSEGREDQTVDINGEGNWTFNAVEELGTYEFSLTATRGFDTSDTVDFSVEVAATGPAITAPENGSTVVGSVNAISGTGEPGAEVTVAGDASGTATVNGEGNWSVEVNLGPGEYRVSATQVVDGDESAVTSSSFTVIPDAPVITTPEDGVNYRAATAPEGAEGTGIEDATITVFLNDEEIGETTVENGEWNVAFEDGLKAGDYTLRAVQTVNEQSNDAGVSFALLEDAAAPGPGDDLPRTGIAAMLPYILGGAALLAAGGAAMEIRRRRGLGDIA
ncbi:hypothetical protein JL108_02020 [Aeromicrobium sp. YIM 150415]|uniref:S1 family peptidase n=1 Tax=Aeromicrobium sp. YIM 150415 TaxID=2803912 RepID=UPI0019629431|nr:S1 family peptidase [Aeromicrobium sp. YIM 150415]MBM9462205.1 hypothetical protein [Aeromicrobium sp. YIM 150415]